MKKNKLGALLLTGILLAGTLVACQTKAGNDTAEGDLLAQIKSAGAIKVGTEGTYPPYSYHDESGTLVGYDVEIAEAIADKLGVKAEFVETKWDSMIAGLDAVRFDVVVNQVGITEERLEKYDFSVPYTFSKGALVVTGDNEDIKTFDDISGKKAAQSLTSNWGKLAEGYGAELVGTDGFNQSIELVISGRADATINDDATFYDYKKQKPDADIKIAALSDESSKSAVLIRKDNKTLVEAIDQAFAELQEEGKIKEISEKYFGTDISVE